MKTVNSNPRRCHLCLLPIPPEITSASHPLLGTIDHVVPLSKGGVKLVSNRAPAHRICNAIKGNMWPLPMQKRLIMVDTIVRQFGLRKTIITREKIAKIKRTIRMESSAKPDLVAAKRVIAWSLDGLS